VEGTEYGKQKNVLRPSRKKKSKPILQNPTNAILSLLEDATGKEPKKRVANAKGKKSGKSEYMSCGQV